MTDLEPQPGVSRRREPRRGGRGRGSPCLCPRRGTSCRFPAAPATRQVLQTPEGGARTVRLQTGLGLCSGSRALPSDFQ